MDTLLSGGCSSRWYSFCLGRFSQLLLIVCFVLPTLTALDIRNQTVEYHKSDAEYSIQDDIHVGQGGILIVHPGVRLRFAPGVGVTVKEGGVLIANGTHADPILFTSQSDPLSAFFSQETKRWPDLRLVDGDRPNEGRLQIRYKNEWRSVCTNSRNWTQADLGVVCQQIGFGGNGFIYRWFEKYNHTEQLSLWRPDCKGHEINLQTCSGWDNRLLGSGVCDYHLDIGIQCPLKLGVDSSKHWRGISFLKARASRRKRFSNRVERLISKSILHNVTIRSAGRDHFGEAVAALHVIGNPPVMQGLRVENSAFTGLNVTMPEDYFIVQDSKFVNNRGNGIFVNSSRLQVHLRNVDVSGNGADGIHYAYHEAPVSSSEQFCSSPMGSVFPQKFVQISADASHGCFRTISIPQFQRHKDEQLTLLFKDFRRVPLDWDEQLKDYFNRRDPELIEPTVSVYDGAQQYEEFLLGTFVINNNTKPHTFASKRGYHELTVVHRAASLVAVTFSLEVYLDQAKVHDVNCTNCAVSSNNGRGIWARDIVSGVAIRKSLIANNDHIAGVHIQNGVGDVVVNKTIVRNNVGDGVNVTFAGGYRHFEECTIEGNTMNGVVLNTNHTSECLAFNYTVHVSRSEIRQNQRFGLFFGSNCLANGLWNVSLSTFAENGDAGIAFESCHLTAAANSSLHISHNRFLASNYLAVKIKPIYNVDAFVENNIFQEHRNGALLISNQDSDWSYANRSAYAIVRENYFRSNNGSFVVKVGVMQDSASQQLLFVNNVLERNYVSELFASLRPRSRVAAVVAVESNNTVIYRNKLFNPESKYELGVHLEDSSKVINATLNYWSTPSRDEGEQHARHVYLRIFDRKDRYNLASVELFPYLIAPYDLNTRDQISSRYDRERVMSFDTQGNTKKIGGEIVGDFHLGPGEYQVGRDIYVRSNAKLTIHPQTKLLFEQSIGLMVQGELRAIGSSDEKIYFTAFTDPSGHEMPHDESLPLGAPISLSQGTYGRVEVVVNGHKGGVCSHGFGKREAAVICHQLGYIMSDRDWQLEEIDMPDTPMRAVISGVTCKDEHSDFFSCRHRVLEDVFESNACSQLVGIRCYRSSWSGIRLGPAARRSVIMYAEISSAGQLDYSTHKFKPALQIDMNNHEIKSVRIDNNMASGIGIMWNNVFAQKRNPPIQMCVIEANNKHGVETRAQGVELSKNTIQNNAGAGIFYNPLLSRQEHLEMRQWTPTELSVSIPPADRKPLTVKLEPDQAKFLILGTSEPNVEFEFEIQCRDSMSIGILVMSPFQAESTENVSFHKGRKGSNRKSYETWNLRRNLTSFPLREAGYIVTAKYESGPKPVGGAVVYLHPSNPLGVSKREEMSTNGKIANSASTSRITSGRNSKSLDERRFLQNLLRRSYRAGVTTHHGWLEYVPSIQILGNSLENNLHAFWSSHFNRDQGEQGEFFNRYSNETILFAKNILRGSRKQSVYVSTPHWDPLRHQLAEINYTFIDNNISKNFGGISQYSRDIRSSNNLYHWTIANCSISGNQGGIQLRLPYVLQYNENFTHSIVFEGNTYRDNKYGIHFDGHFARLNITSNTFTGNECPKGVLTISGMEKESRISENLIDNNVARYAVEINMQSHSEEFNQVPANFFGNIIRETSPFSTGKYSSQTDGVAYQPKSYALALKGVQQFNISRNVFQNPLMEFEFVAGIAASSITHTLNVKSNYWGTPMVPKIQERIFDFDDWNNYAIAEFVPFLGSASATAADLYEDLSRLVVDVNKPLGGRLYTNLTLSDTHTPYVIRSDLTVMPGATLTVTQGVTIEVYPSVGILVLGDLNVMGRERNPVVFQPVRSLFSNRFVQKRQLALRDFDDLSVRLCTDQACDDPKQPDGFVEVFNKTTLQWVPVCDPRFTERSAQVVCSALGHNRVNVQLHRGPRTDVGINEILRVRSWTHPLECSGEETSLADCEWRLNGYGVKDYSCSHSGEQFVYVHCGNVNRFPDEEYWGGIRFSVPDNLAESQRAHQDHLARFSQSTSSIQFAVIQGAGILHNEKAAAVQVLQRKVTVQLCNISNNAHAGLEIVASPGFQFVHGVNFTNNMGPGLNVLTLHGQTNTRDSNFTPLKRIDVSYNMFGLVDICDSNKEFVLKGRILLYYKYDSKPVDCIKIFRTDVESMGFRILQFNLFNATNYSPNPDNIALYDGDIFNYTSPLLGTLFPNHEQKSFYETRLGRTLSVRLHATGGSAENGFIAEVLPLPARTLAGRELMHNVTACHFLNNERGAIAYRSAGEITPTIGFRYNRVEQNGQQLFGNFSSVPGSLFFDVQNVLHFDVIENTVFENQGGLYVKIDSDDSVSAVKAIVRNNLFFKNLNRETVAFMGGKAGSLQYVHMFRNYVSKNQAEFANNIVFHKVSMNFSENLVVGNRGQHQLAVFGFNKQLSNDQLVYMNYIWDNEATLAEEKATILAMSPGQIYRYNYLFNRMNYFELVAANRSIMDQESRNYIYQHQPLQTNRKDPIFVDATNNWWGFSEVVSVSGRVKDALDESELLKVQFEKFLSTNQSLIDGHCVGGWKKIGSTCFLFVPASMNYEEAKKFCQADAASLPYLKGRYDLIGDYILSVQDDFDILYDKLWVQSIDVPLDECAVLYRQRITTFNCQERLPFLCERTQEIFVSLGDQWYVDPLSIGAMSVSLILLLGIALFSLFWCCKSHERHLEKMERRNSIRASIRSNRGFEYQGSLDSVTKLPFSMRSQQTLDYSDVDELDEKFANDSQLENATISQLVKPSFSMTFENQGYHDQSRDSRDWSQGTGSTLDMKREIDAEGPRGGERGKIARDHNTFSAPAYEMKSTSVNTPSIYETTQQKLPPAPPTPPTPMEDVATLPLHSGSMLHAYPSRMAPPRPKERPPQPPAPSYENAPAMAFRSEPSRPDQPKPEVAQRRREDALRAKELSKSLEPLRSEDVQGGGHLPCRSLNASSGSLKPAPLETAM